MWALIEAIDKGAMSLMMFNVAPVKIVVGLYVAIRIVEELRDANKRGKKL